MDTNTSSPHFRKSFLRDVSIFRQRLGSSMDATAPLRGTISRTVHWPSRTRLIPFAYQSILVVASDGLRLELELKRQNGPPALQIIAQALFEEFGVFKAQTLGLDIADFNRQDRIQEPVTKFAQLFADDGSISLGLQ